MSFLAEACALIAYQGYHGSTMSPDALRVMRSEDVLVSPITVWEITRKVALGKLVRPHPPGFAGRHSDYLRSLGYRIAPFGWEEAEHANGLPDHHRDPTDRMLIATAVLRRLTIVSNDGVFGRYGVATVW